MANLNLKYIKENTVSELVRNGISASEAKIETEILLEHVTGLSKLEQLLKPDYEFNQEEQDKFQNLLVKRINERIPVQYLTNKAYFMGYEFYVDENVLIPRPETELLVEEVIKLASIITSRHSDDLSEESDWDLSLYPEQILCFTQDDRKKAQDDEKKAEDCGNSEYGFERKLKIADIGTGSGCIAVSLAKNLANAEVIATDISEKSINVAKINAKKLKVEDKITFKQTNILDGIDEIFDIIVSNPPYIPESDKGTLEPEVLLHEPYKALFAGDEEGIEFYERITMQAQEKLSANSYIAFEIGIKQAEGVKMILQNAGFKDILTIKDYAGIERIIVARK